MSLKVALLPHPEKAPDGLQRVLRAMYDHLPAHDIELVSNPVEADLLNCHALAGGVMAGKPLVFSSHGLHWARFGWPAEYHRVNRVLIDRMAAAQAITVPSNWVAHAYTRGMLRNPKVVYHGVDPAAWQPSSAPEEFVLWNKARTDPAVHPGHVTRLADGMPDISFVSTFGPVDRPNPPNLRTTGRIPHSEMRQLVPRAGVYLVTTPESFGVATLEALSCGVPVAGWDICGQSEIVVQGETGYLAPFGDYHALADAIRQCLAERKRLGANARADVIERWQWGDKIEAYAELFHDVYEQWTWPRPRVSVIVTVHNLEDYIADCLDSLLAQTEADWECIVVDDCSEDNSREAALRFAEVDDRIKVITTPRNLGLSGARNYGFEHATGRYILPLDADDMLDRPALELLANALDGDPFIHIAYGHLDLIGEDGSGRRRGDWPFDEFNWYQQMAHLNQLPYSAMMRREVLEQSGGYRERDWRAEDASLWCRLTSFGFRAAKVTDHSTLIYRVRGNSKGALERAKHKDADGDWTAWYPWRIGARTGQEGFELLRRGTLPPENLVPFGAQGDPVGESWLVHDYRDPLISVIIPVGPGHDRFLVDALDSLVAQTFPLWEAVVVNDTRGALSAEFAPYARIVEHEGQGIGSARNAGLRAARSPLVLFLDADDILVPDALRLMLESWIEQGGGRFIYTDWYSVSSDGVVKHKQSLDYDRGRWKVSHPISVLMDRDHALAVGGFDEEAVAWEDWDFFMKLKVDGYCGHHLSLPLLVYRIHTGQRREQSLGDADKMLPVLRERYGDYFEGGKSMASGCCGGNGDAILRAKAAFGQFGNVIDNTTEARFMSDTVRLEYIGTNRGAITFNLPGMSQPVRGGNNAINRYADVPAKDAELLLGTGKWKQAKSPTGIDLQQAAVAKPEAVAVEAAGADGPGEAPQPEEPTQREDLKDPSDMTVDELREYALGLGSVSLRKMIEAERDGKNRVTAIGALEMMLEDVERVG